MTWTPRLRQLALVGAACGLWLVVAACGAADTESGNTNGSGSSASTVFVPGEAPPMPPLPPGAGPHGPNPNPDPTPDAAPKDAAGDAPADVAAQ